MSRTPISEQFSAFCRSVRRRHKESSSGGGGGGAATAIKWQSLPNDDDHDDDDDESCLYHSPPRHHRQKSGDGDGDQRRLLTPQHDDDRHHQSSPRLQQRRNKNSSSSSKLSQHKDFIRELTVRGPNVRVIASRILEYLDYASLRSAELVSTYWRSAVVAGKLYRKLFERNIRTNADWKEMHRSDQQWFDIPRGRTRRAAGGGGSSGSSGSSKRRIGPVEKHKLYKQFCRDVVVAIESLESNWRGLKVGRQTLSHDKETFASSGVKHFHMDSQRIVTHVICQNFNFFNVYNRWTLELERRIMPHIRYVPIKEGGGGDCSFHFCNDLLAIFCPNYGFSMMTQDSQQIWRVSTGTKLYAFDDFGVLESMAFVHQDHGCWERIKGAVGGRISPSGKYYAFWRMSHYTLKKKTNNNKTKTKDQQQQQQQCPAATQPMECRFMLTLRTINQQPPPPPQQHHPAADHSGGGGEERQVQQQHSIHSSTLVDSIRKVERYGSNGLYTGSHWSKLFLDDTYTIVHAFFGSQQQQSSSSSVDIRSTPTLNIVHTISNAGHVLDYSSGYMIARPWHSPPDSVQIWDVKTGTCLANISNAPSSTIRPRLIGDKYLVRFSNCRLRIYDLQQLVNQQQLQRHRRRYSRYHHTSSSSSIISKPYVGDGSEFLISKFQLPPNHRLVSYDHMLADKYQIYLIAGVQFQNHLSCVDLLDFTAADAYSAPASATSKQDAAAPPLSPFVVAPAPATAAHQQQQQLPDLKKLFLSSKKEMENSFGNLFDL